MKLNLLIFFLSAKEKKGVQFNEEVDVKVMETLTDEVEIDEVSQIHT